MYKSKKQKQAYSKTEVLHFACNKYGEKYMHVILKYFT